MAWETVNRAVQSIVLASSVTITWWDGVGEGFYFLFFFLGEGF